MEQSRRVQYLVAFAVSLAIMVNSMINFWSTPVLPRFYNNEIIPNITSSEISWIVAIVPYGMIIGSFTSTGISDYFGRRTTLLVSAVPYVVGTVLVLWAINVWMLYVARVLWGVGSGMVTTVSNMYLSEIADKEIRGTLTAGTRFMFSVGSLIILSSGSFISYNALNWYIIGFPACYFVACWFIPESPYYLLKEGKVEAAKKVLVKLSSSKNEEMVEEKLYNMQSDVKKEMERSSSLKELFTGKQYRRAIIVAGGLRFTQIMTGVIPIQIYLGRILDQSNCGINLSMAFIVYGAARFLIGLISPFIVDRYGRRPLLILTYSLASVLLFVIGGYFFYQQITKVTTNNGPVNPVGYIVYVSIVLYIIVANIGFDVLVFIIPSEVFPLNIKAIAMTVFSVFSSLVMFLSVKLHQVMGDYIGLSSVFWMYAVMALFGAIFTYFAIPETKGKSLREIQIQLQGDIYNDNDRIEVGKDDAVTSEETERLNGKGDS